MPDPNNAGTDVGVDDIWRDLVDGHAAFAAAHPVTASTLTHRPRAAVLACSDARVPPSLLFDQDPGSLFVVRLAGNSATPAAIASLTYAVEALGTRLVVVLGHTECGAIAGALDRTSTDTAVLAPILTPIDEMLLAYDACGDPRGATIANVRHNLGRLGADRGPLGAAIRTGRVTLRGAVHDLGAGRLVRVDDPVDGPVTEPTAPAYHHHHTHHHGTAPELTRSSP